MITVGLTGGIGSGKSEVARLLVQHGAVLIDADVLAREAVDPGTPGLARVVEEFGAGVLATDGSLDRPRLAALVFGDAERLAALNGIVHPYVASRRSELTAAASPDAVVVHDVPLLVENHLEADYDVVVVVDAPEAVRLSRLTGPRGMTAGDARTRMAAQATRQQRLAVADVVLDNGGDINALQQQINRLWQTLQARAAPGS